MTKAERETTINFNDEEAHAEITTFQRRMLTKLSRNKAARKLRDIEMGGKIIGAVFEVPKSLIRIRSAKRALSDHERQRRQENLMKMRQKRKEAGGALSLPLDNQPAAKP